MQGEINKFFWVPPHVFIAEPSISDRYLHASNGKREEEPTLSSRDIQQMEDDFARDMEEAAPDLRSNGLSKLYSKSLFAKLVQDGVDTRTAVVSEGARTFYHVGKDVLGPLAVSFVDTTLREVKEGKIIYPARDATPFFYIAKALKKLDPDAYAIKEEDILNPVFNRKLWGIEDEQDRSEPVLEITNPLVQRLLTQMGFGSGLPTTFVEVGAWGSMVDQLKDAMQKGKLPCNDFSVYFFYTHIPENISGYTNQLATENLYQTIPESVLETIADTWEAFPKFFRRPTQLVEEDGFVKASLEGKLINSSLLPTWSYAALHGVVDAAKDFVTGESINPIAELERLWELSNAAQTGHFTGILPGHTESWSEGAAWKANWRWGKIPPLK